MLGVVFVGGCYMFANNHNETPPPKTFYMLFGGGLVLCRGYAVSLMSLDVVLSFVDCFTCFVMLLCGVVLSCLVVYSLQPKHPPKTKTNNETLKETH